MLLFLGIFTFLTTFGLADAVLHQAYDEYYYSNGYRHYIGPYRLSGDVVYEDGSGYTDYAIWMAGNCYHEPTYYSTRVLVYFYISAYYEQENLYPHHSYQYYWDPIPSSLISWGDFEVHPEASRWDWTIDQQQFYSTRSGFYHDLYSTFQGDYSANSVNGDYRYIGYTRGDKAGGHTDYDALLRLHVDNNLAKAYKNGVFGGYQMNQVGILEL